MRKIILIAISFLFLFTLPYCVHAQENNSVRNSINMSIPSLSLISFNEGEQNITQQTEVKGDGQVSQIISSPGEETWINYASIVEEGFTNEITIQISSGYIPPGIQVKVLPGDYTGNGKGEVGTAAELIVLSQKPRAIIENIGSCYTGKGVNNGHKLSYIWETTDNNKNIEDYENYSITVTYTIKSSQ